MWGAVCDVPTESRSSSLARAQHHTPPLHAVAVAWCDVCGACSGGVSLQACGGVGSSERLNVVDVRTVHLGGVLWRGEGRRTLPCAVDVALF